MPDPWQSQSVVSDPQRDRRLSRVIQTHIPGPGFLCGRQYQPGGQNPQFTFMATGSGGDTTLTVGVAFGTATGTPFGQVPIRVHVT